MTARRDVLTGRWLRTDAPSQAETERPPPKQCSLCDAEMHAKGLCQVHYGAQARLSAGRKPQVPDAKCRICGGPHMAMGLCGKHYDETKNKSLPVRFRHFKSHAKSSGRTVSLTYDQFAVLAVKPCHYCGSVGAVKNGRGLDRINSGGHYDADNVVPCCWTCNFMKRHLSVQEWVAHMQKALAHIGSHERMAELSAARDQAMQTINGARQ